MFAGVYACTYCEGVVLSRLLYINLLSLSYRHWTTVPIYMWVHHQMENENMHKLSCNFQFKDKSIEELHCTNHWIPSSPLTLAPYNGQSKLHIKHNIKYGQVLHLSQNSRTQNSDQIKKLHFTLCHNDSITISKYMYFTHFTKQNYPPNPKASCTWLCQG